MHTPGPGLLAPWLAPWLAFVLPLFSASAAASPQLELHVHSGAQPLVMQRLGAAQDARGRPLALSRVDLLLSGLALQRSDGRWHELPGWHGFFRGEPPWRREPLRGLPPGRYTALRFAVGVAPEANHADPNRLPPDDPLHPMVNHLHWGWTGGYVFLALEGHWQFDHAPTGSTGGFSYHVAGKPHRVPVLLKGPLTVSADSVLRLRLDAAALLRGLDIARDGDSTHSRSEDAALRAIKTALPRAFALDPAAGADSSATLPVATPAAGRSRTDAGTAAAAASREPYAFHIGANMPSVALPPDNMPSVAGVALGRSLFHDPRLSRQQDISCATCHQHALALTDGRALARGTGGQTGTRNTMPLFNLAWAQAFFWDGRSVGLRHQALVPIEDPREMGAKLPVVVARLKADPAMQAQFQRAFGGPPNAARIGLALEQYLLTLVSQDSKFDRAMKGSATLSAQEKRGLELFLTEHDPPRGLRGADCFHCHGGSLFTNNRFTNNGLPLRGGDTGRERVSADPADRGKFKTPSLRNVALTAPYMHDGRLRTLEEVVDHYDRGVQRSPTLDPNLAKHPPEGLRLSAEDKAALVAFLRTLTDPQFSAATALPIAAPARGR